MSRKTVLAKSRSFFKNVDITGGPIVSSMLIYAVPLIITNVLQFLYNAVDVMVVGNFASEGAIASVGATTSIVNLITNVIMGMSVGSSILIARSVGEKNDLETPRIINTTFILSISLGVAALIIGEIFALPLLHVTDCPENIIDGAELYIRIYMLGLPASAFYNYMASVLRSVGDSKRPLIYLTVSGLTNVTLNLILVICFGMDVAGVAIATVASQYLSAILLFVRLTRLEGAVRLVPKNARIVPIYVWKILKYGIPNSISNLAFSFSNLQIQTVINSYGDAAISGYTASNNLQGIFMNSITNAFAVMCSTFVGENIGAGNRKRTLKVVLYSYIISFVSVSFSIVMCTVFRSQLLSLFIPGQPEALAYGIICNNYILGFGFLLAVIVINNQIVQAFGYTTYQMIASLVSLCVFRIVWLAFVYPQSPTFDCLMLTYPISWGLNLISVIPFVAWCLLKYSKGRNFKL